MSTPKPHRRLSLTRPTLEDEAAAEAADPTAADWAVRLQALERRCADLEAQLERRCADLEAQLERRAAEPLVAPVIVAREDGRPLLKIDADEQGASLRLFDAAGNPVTVLCASNAGGRVEVLSLTGEKAVLAPQSSAEPRREPEPGAAIRLSVKPTGGPTPSETEADPTLAPEVEPLTVQLRRGENALALYDRAGRKAVAVYAEGLGGAVRVYDQGGACVFSQH